MTQLKTDIRKWYERFCAWQQMPFSYEISEDIIHRCNNCNHEYAGNFCPCCGQKAGVGKVDWASAKESVMDIWGMGSRSMTYTLLQLFLRPGYLIRDYISGKRQVSFPPVKMLILVAIICGIIMKFLMPEIRKPLSDTNGLEAITAFFDWAESNRGWASLAIYSMMILPTWALFHYSPRCSAHTLPQGFFIQVFLSTLAVIFSTLSKFVPFVDLLIPIYYIISYRQLFGYGWWATVWRILMVLISAGLIVIAIIMMVTDLSAKSGAEADASVKMIQLSIAAVFLILSVAILSIGYTISKYTSKKRTK